MMRNAANRGSFGRKGSGVSGPRLWAYSILLLSSALGIAFGEETGPAPGGGNPAPISSPRHFLTSTAQFRELARSEYLDGCAFQLTGVVTLVDTGRDLIVLQDAAGPLALNLEWEPLGLRTGERVTVSGSNCCPYYASFPSYPFRPSGSEILPSFEAPGISASITWLACGVTCTRP